MNREFAAREVLRHASGLPVDDAGVGRLLERISTSDDPEGLRAALIERGARVVLEDANFTRKQRVERAIARHMERNRA